MEANTPKADADRRALESVLGDYFASQQLEAESLLYLHRSLVPSLVLWIHAWHPLPEMVAWLAILGWAMCAALAVVLAWVGLRRRARLLAALPDARRVVRVDFVPSEDTAPVASALLLHLSVAASVVLWLHALAPRVLGTTMVSIAAKSWVLLLAAALVNRYLERS